MCNLEETVTRRYINSLSKDELLKLHKEFSNDDVFYYYDNLNRELALEFIEKDFTLFEELSNKLEFSDIDHYLKSKPEEIRDHVYWLASDVIKNYTKPEILEFYKKYHKDLGSWQFSEYFSNNLSLNEFDDELALDVVTSGSYINLNEKVIEYIEIRLNSDINLLPKFLKEGVHESLVHYLVNKNSKYAEKITLELMVELYNISPRYSFYYFTEALNMGLYGILNHTPNWHNYLYNKDYSEKINTLDIEKLDFDVDIWALVYNHKNLKYETVKKYISYFKFLKYKMVNYK